MTRGLLVARVALVVALAGVAILSLLPPERLPSDVEFSDTLLHALGYAVLGALAVASGLGPATALVGVVAFGLLLEVAQLLTGYRSFEWRDLLADAAGAAIGICAAAVARRVRTSQFAHNRRG